MKRIVALFAVIATISGVAGCSKPTEAPTSGPSLNAPAQQPASETPASTESAAPAGESDPPASEAAPADESAPAAEEKKGAAIGQPGAAWANLEGTDGKKHGLSDLAEAEVVTVVFTCNSCPVAKEYQERLKKFVDDYEDKGVELVAINVNNIEADKLPAMKERAEKEDFNFAYLYDPSQEIARAYGAAVTPHAFVLDKSRNVVYMGAIDDNMDESDISKHFLRDAVDAALAGKAPEVTETKAQGCGIQYE